jgi:hypothetical protein
VVVAQESIVSQECGAETHGAATVVPASSHVLSPQCFRFRLHVIITIKLHRLYDCSRSHLASSSHAGQFPPTPPSPTLGCLMLSIFNGYPDTRDLTTSSRRISKTAHHLHCKGQLYIIFTVYLSLHRICTNRFKLLTIPHEYLSSASTARAQHVCSAAKPPSSNTKPPSPPISHTSKAKSQPTSQACPPHNSAHSPCSHTEQSCHPSPSDE